MMARLHLCLAVFFLVLAAANVLMAFGILTGLLAPMQPWVTSSAAMLALGWIMLAAAGDYLAKARGEDGR